MLLTIFAVVLEKTLASPLDCKDIQPVHSKGDPDETVCTEDPEELLNYLSEVGHPVLGMEPFDM